MSDSTLSAAPRLTASEAEAVVLRVAELAASGAALAEGLRAASAEAPSSRTRAALRRIGEAIQQGSTLEQALHGSCSNAPAYISNFLLAAERTGKLGVVLTEWVENQWATRNRWRMVTSALFYPVVSLVLTFGIFTFMALYVVPPFREMFTEWGLRLPIATISFFRLCDVGVPAIGLFTLIVVFGLAAVYLAGGRAALSRLMTAIPLFGEVWHWSASAEGLRAIGLLVENRIPLPEALALSSSGVSDPYIAQCCRLLARQTEAGQAFWSALVETRVLPLSIVPIIRQGEQTGTLDAALRTAAEMLEARIKDSSLLIVQILPPLIFVFLAVMIGMFIVAMFVPLVGLIQGLS